MPTPPFARFATKSALYLLSTLSEHLPNARRLLASLPLRATDGGEGGDFTLSVDGASSSQRGVIRLPGAQLGGTADAPDVRGIRATGGAPSTGPVLLAFGDVASGQVLGRVGDTVVGVDAVLTTGGGLGADLNVGAHKITNLASGTAPGDAATYGQLSSMINGLDWQASVLDKDEPRVETPDPRLGDG